ncbi:MAG: helix-turn-helix domain-containing protein [Polyangiaceae bacterium]
MALAVDADRAEEGFHGMGQQAPSFGMALCAVRQALGMSQDVFGARLGVSRRTLTRWEAHDELPSVAQRKHLATSFPDVPVELRAALVRSLGLGEGFVASMAGSQHAASPPAAVVDAASAAAIVDGAFLELCEAVDVAPGRLRAGLVAFLRRIEASGVSLPEARARLAPKPTAAPRRG